MLKTLTRTIIALALFAGPALAQQNFNIIPFENFLSSLPSPAPLTGTESLYILQGAAGKRVPLSQLQSFIVPFPALSVTGSITPGDFACLMSSTNLQDCGGISSLPVPTGYLNVANFGAIGDAKSYTGGTITAGTNSFTASTATFSAADTGKSIVIDYAGVAGAPLVTTIAGFVSAHNVVLAANASTTVPNTLVSRMTVATAQSGAGSYAPGDTITLTGGTGTAAVATVTHTSVSSATVNAGGTGGTTGTCTVVGTTGTALAGKFFTANVTISGGAITVVNSITTGGFYRTNPTSLTAEPVANSSGCGAISGATLTLNMGVNNVYVSNAGAYSIAPASPASQGSTSGSGTGATFTLATTTSGFFTYGTDATAAFQSAFNAANTNFANGIGSCVFMPSGAYFISSPMTLLTHKGCVIGAGKEQSVIYLSPSFSGDLFSWADAWLGTPLSQPYNGTSSPFSASSQGPILRDFTVYGDRNSSNTQNVIMFYDHNDYATISNIDAFYLPGRLLGMGIIKNDASAYMRESQFMNLRCFLCGTTAGIPAISVDGQGNAAGSSDLRFDHIEIYSPFGPGMLIDASGVSIDILRIEGQEAGGSNIQADLLSIGDGNQTFTINQVHGSHVTLIDPYYGFASVHLNAPNSGLASFDIRIEGDLVGGLPYGRGLQIDFGRDNYFFFNQVNTRDYNVQTSVNAGGNNMLWGHAAEETTWTYNVASATNSIYSLPHRVGVPVGNTTGSFPTGAGNAALTVIRHDGSIVGGNTPGNGAVDLQIVRNVASQIASGTDSMVVGSFNTASGTNSISIGNSNVASGNNSVVYGIQGVDRGRLSNFVFSSPRLASNGDNQVTVSTLKGTGNTASAIRLTVDGNAAGSTNCINIPNNSGFVINVDVMAFDHTTVSKNESWNNWGGLYTRGANTASTALTMQSTPTPLSNGTVTGSAIAATADTTQGCLNISFTPPTSNTDTWNIVARVTTVETQ